jgi:glutathione synthase/RimK-type ligase-like ATP-grasp enzyme
MNLLWGRAADAPLAAVHAALVGRGAPCFFVDESRAPATTIQIAPGSATAGTLCVDGRLLRLEDVSGVYCRPYGPDRLLQQVELRRRDEVARRCESIGSVLWTWTDLSDALVLNRPSLMSSSASKPLQARLLAALGFEVPATLITNDLAAARAFLDEHRCVIYKSISSIRSVVARMGTADAIRLDEINECPVQFQAYIPGVDCRVHVVGERLFACEIESDAVDYRYAARDEREVRLRACELPSAIADRCRQVGCTLGLPLCGIDLRRTTDGRWIAFEANPSPGFTYFAAATGAPIADAIAELLIRGS